VTLDPKTPVTLPLGLVNDLLAYLGTKPYVEVQGVIGAVQATVVPQLQPKPAEPEAEA
jgi:hypothetical protein